MEQTNRTILFEEINPEKEDLFSLIGDVKNKQSLTDDEVSIINHKLLVRSFDEFLTKFEPGLYGMVDMSRMNLGFSKEKLWTASNTFYISIQKNMPFMASLFQLLKADDNTRIIDNCIAEKLVSVLEAESVYDLKELIKRVKEEYLFGDIKNAWLILEQIAEGYDKGIVLLRVLIEALPRQIEAATINKSNPLILKEVKKTQLDIVRMSRSFKEYEFSIEEELKEDYLEFIQSFFEGRRTQGKTVYNEEAMQLCLLMGAYVAENVAYMLDRYSVYQELYQNVLQALWSEMRPLLQNILGIYTFFEQYGADGNIKEGMRPSVLIVNRSPESIQSVEKRERLAIYLDTVNNKSFNQDAIWYAVLPAIAYKKDNIQDKVRERFRSREKEKRELFYKETAHSEEDIRHLLKILSEYQIICFLSILGKKSTAFAQFVKDGMDNYNETFYGVIEGEHNEFVVPCVPNFTIIPQEFMELELGPAYTYDDFADDGVKVTGTRKIWLDGLYLEASYVAAGLAAAWQCPTYLKKHYKNNVTLDLPGTAYRIMDKEHRFITKTTMLREIVSYHEELKDDIEKHSIGVVFMPAGQRVIMATDRCSTYQNGSLDCISTVQTLVYMERVIRHETQDFKNTLIKTFFQNRPGSIKARWFENKSNVNAMMKESENITYQLNENENTCIFEVNFREINKSKKVTTSS